MLSGATPCTSPSNQKQSLSSTHLFCHLKIARSAHDGWLWSSVTAQDRALVQHRTELLYSFLYEVNIRLTTSMLLSLEPWLFWIVTCFSRSDNRLYRRLPRTFRALKDRLCLQEAGRGWGHINEHLDVSLQLGRCLFWTELHTLFITIVNHLDVVKTFCL